MQPECIKSLFGRKDVDSYCPSFRYAVFPMSSAITIRKTTELQNIIADEKIISDIEGTSDLMQNTSVSNDSSSGVDLSRKLMLSCNKQQQLQKAQNVSVCTQLQLFKTLVSNQSFSSSGVKSAIVCSSPLSSVTGTNRSVHVENMKNSSNFVPNKFLSASRISISLNDVLQYEKSATIFKIQPEVSTEEKQEVMSTAGSNYIIKSHNNLSQHVSISQNCSTTVVGESKIASVIQHLCRLEGRSPETALYPINPVTLHKCLWPSLKEIIIQDPESICFRKPVNTSQKDYYELIKQPIDLATIKIKLESGQYADGWDFIDDVWLMFNNAWLYYRRTSCQYRHCLKLSEKFKASIDSPMQKFGHCCGQYYVFEPRTIPCYNKVNCVIVKYDNYWSYNERYNFCKKCYSQIEGDVSLSSSGETLTVGKDKLIEKKNDIFKKELFVECIMCARLSHKICVLHFEEIWKEGFICDYCLVNIHKIKKIPSIFTSETLPHTKLGSYIEKRVKVLLEEQKCSSEVIVRVVYQGRNTFEVKQGAKSRYVDYGNWPEYFPYTAKTLLAFQKIDDVDVCFFAMFVQEYDAECPQPNTRRVYIAYLDSVHFFNPKHLRTAVYHEILLGYLDYIKSLGYTTVHLWSCPSNKGEDYIFFCHPDQQKSQSIKRLQEWYKKMLDKGIQEGIVKSYKDLYKQALEDNVQSVSELPYFDGDYWPNTIENEILRLEGKAAKVACRSMKMAMLEANDKEGNEATELDVEKTSKCKKNKNLKNKKNSLCSRTGDPLTDKIYSLMAKHKEVFIVIHLCSSNASTDSMINDPDPAISSDIMDARESLLELCRENDCEFSSLRRAKYSTMILLYELYKEKVDTVTCNFCRDVLQSGLHCPVCKDFDLCRECFASRGHDHDMEKLNVDSEPKIYEEYRMKYIKAFHSSTKWSINLNHVSCCSNANCLVSTCKEFRNLEKHSQAHGMIERCSICSLTQFISLKHYRMCRDINCQIFLCRKWRIKTASNENGGCIKSNGASGANLSADSTSDACKIPQNISQLPNVDLSQNYFKESQTHSHAVTTLNCAVNAFPMASQLKDQDSACISNFIPLSNVSTMEAAVICSIGTSNSLPNSNSCVNSAVKLDANVGHVQKFDIATLPKCISPTIDIRQELPSAVPSSNNCYVSRDTTKVAYRLRNAKPSFQSPNLYMLLNGKKCQSNSNNILPVSGSITENCAAQNSVEIYEQYVPINDINMQMSHGYSSQITSNKQKDLLQNVSSDTDSKQNLKNLLYSGGYSIESNQLYSWNNRNEKSSQMQTESNFESLFCQSIVAENKSNSSFNGDNVNRYSFPQYPVHHSVKPIPTSQKSEIASGANYLSNKNELKIQCNSYQTSDTFSSVANHSVICSRNVHQDIENHYNLVHHSTLQPSKPFQFDNNSAFSPQNSPIVGIDSIKSSRERDLQNSSPFTGNLHYTGTKVQSQAQVSPNVSNLENKHATAHINEHSHSIFSSEQNPLSSTNEADNFIFLQIPSNPMQEEKYDYIETYSNCSTHSNKYKQTTISEPLQNFTQPADIYIPYDDSKIKGSFSPSTNSTFTANINVENSNLHPLSFDTASNVTNFKHSEPFLCSSRLSSDDSHSSYSEIFNVSPIQQNCNYKNNKNADQNMYNTYETMKSYQSNFTDNSSHNEPYAAQHSMLNTTASYVKKLESHYQTYTNPQLQFSYKHLYKAHRAPTSSQQKQYMLSELNNDPHKLDCFMKNRAFQQNQLKKQLLQNSRELPNAVFHSNLSNQQLPTMQKSALNSVSAFQTSIRLPVFQCFKSGSCNNYQNISSNQSISSDYPQNISSNHPASQ